MFKKVNPEKLFLFTGLLVGLLLCFLVPIGAGYDEDTHIARIWEISHGNLIPNSLFYTGPNFPSVFYELSYRQKNVLDPVSLHFISENINRRIDWNNMIKYATRSLYNPSLYVVQAIIMGFLGRLLDTPVLIIYYLCRISYLLIYMGICYLAIKVIPFGKWLLATLALSPMAISQAAVISADPITNAVCFLFLAYLLHLRFQKEQITRKDTWILLLLLALLFTVKINGIVLTLLIFLLPREKFQNKKLWNQLIWGGVVLFLVLVIGWNLLAFSLPRPFLVETGVDPVGQTKFILTQPLKFIKIVFDNLMKYWPVLLKEWIGVMGYRYWAYPDILYILFICLLAFGFWFDDKPVKSISRRDRLILGFAFIVGVLVTLSSLYMLYDPVGSSLINRDGRYYIPLIPLFIFAIYPSKTITFTRFKSVMISGNIILLSIVIFSLFFSYYITCGVNYYSSFGNCYYPVYKNWMPGQKFINEDHSVNELKQTFKVQCPTIDRMRFWIKENSAYQNTYEFDLIDSQSQQIFERKEINDIAENKLGWIEVNFPPLKNQYLHLLEFRLHSIKKEILPTIAVSTRDEYMDGLLVLNGIDQPFDILFQYHCLQNIGQDLKNIFK